MIPICFEKCARLEWKVPFTNTTQMSELSRLNGYVLSGEFLEEKNTAVFSLVEGVSLRTQKGMAQS